MTSPADAPRLDPPVTDRDHALGAPDAPLTLVEYGDYQCPNCGQSHPIVQQLRQTLGDRLRFVFRHFPQSSVHPRAGAAAQAAEAAHAQKKFWPMHDLLFAHQQDLDPPDLVHYALTLGLEIYRFEADLSGHRFARRVAEDYDSGLRLGVKRTPTYFINDLRYDGPTDYDTLLATLSRAESPLTSRDANQMTR